MKKIITFVILLNLLLLVGCSKEENIIVPPTPNNPTINNKEENKNNEIEANKPQIETKNDNKYEFLSNDYNVIYDFNNLYSKLKNKFKADVYNFSDKVNIDTIIIINDEELITYKEESAKNSKKVDEDKKKEEVNKIFIYTPELLLNKIDFPKATDYLKFSLFQKNNYLEWLNNFEKYFNDNNVIHIEYSDKGQNVISKVTINYNDLYKVINNLEKENKIKFNNLSNIDIFKNYTTFIEPVIGMEIKRSFGYNDIKQLDKINYENIYNVQTDDLIYSPCDGIIKNIDETKKAGKIYIETTNNEVVSILNIKNTVVNKGDTIKKGELIGYVSDGIKNQINITLSKGATYYDINLLMESNNSYKCIIDNIYIDDDALVFNLGLENEHGYLETYIDLYANGIEKVESRNIGVGDTIVKFDVLSQGINDYNAKVYYVNTLLPAKKQKEILIHNIPIDLNKQEVIK